MDLLLFTAIVSLLLGIFVFVKGSNKPANLTLAIFSLSLFLWCFAQFMGGLAENKEAVLLWTREGIAGAIFVPVFFLHFILALVEKEQKEKIIIYLAYAMGFILLALDFTRLFVMDVAPTGGFKYYPQPGIVYPAFAVFIMACFIGGFYYLIDSFRAALGQKKNQLLYVIVAAIIGFLGGITAFFPVWGINFPVLSYYGLPLCLLIMVYAIVKHKLLNVSIIIREGLVYSTLTLLFAAFYALAILFTSYWLTNYISFNPLLTMFAAALVSVLVFQPVKDKVQNTVDRIFFKGEYGYKKTINDLSLENRKLFRTLLQADKLASLGTLSAGMAHEIKNPLASIKGMTQVLKENLTDQEFISQFQDVVLRQVERMNNLIEKMLKLGQSQGLSLAKFNLAQLIKENIALIENQCRKKGIEIEENLDSRMEIQADREQIAQVILNLLLNAVQAMDQGGKLQVKAFEDRNGSVIEVVDNGIGIEPDKIVKIFDPFFSTEEGGTGMGLAVAYRVIKEHNGEINVESQAGKGTKFSLWLPIKPKQ